ncbi:MAG: SMP-30/gluconolactonase/LRE family protein [Planctomycetaceae bacterium]|nr:SMP-30/gluconolactonase/LRE family protein [Planctomycetaceae bacterium]
MATLCWCGCLLNLTLAGGCSLNGAEPIEGIGPTGEVKELFTDFAFTEGPASDGKGNLYFTDIPNNRINKVDAQGALASFLEPSGHCNGLMFDQQGMLYASSMDGSLISINVETKETTTLAADYDGKRFNAPNDLVIDKSGGIYFTDPRYRAPDPWPQGVEAVYYRAADGTVTRLLEDRDAPNGVILSPDETKLYVIPSKETTMYVYPVESPGKLGTATTFCELKQPEDITKRGGGDGLTIDVNGNLYITSALGLQVFTPAGEHLGIIEFPQQPANATFGGPENKTLYVTARTSLYAVEMEVAGHVFTGKVSE